ncbi:hypothetical protein [Tenacibaculum aiptasiae]|uniref:hypothetical protein n=1 Tax=Tenacibaculum aiptasiae TaxID=426481 RepID=UPI0023302FCD|nr:hypothetical protein [Tenacibaculum aiptasiae]
MKYTELSLYNESGEAPIINLSLVLIFGILITLFASYFYSLIVTFMPLIYFNFILGLVFGYSISQISYLLNRVFKIRNRKKSIIITLTLAILGVYFQWVSYFYIISVEEVKLVIDTNFFIQILTRPDLLIENIIILNKTGSWELFGFLIKNFSLSIIWILEATIIILMAYSGYKNINIEPFSESTNKWYKKLYIDKDFEQIHLKKDFIEHFNNSVFDTINSLKYGNANRYSRIYIYYLKSETRSLISIENVLISHNDNGKKEVTEILPPCYIGMDTISQLKKEFGLKKISLIDSIKDLYQQ